MGRLFVLSLDGNNDADLNGNSPQIYKCKFCRTHLALAHEIISRRFQCLHGVAYLFNKVSNVTVGVNEDREMTTGMHTVADVFCVVCGSNVGWKYESASVKSQKYKEGKFVLERFKILGPDGSHYFFNPEAPHHDQGSESDSDHDD